jgi:hypothetical protein
VSHAALSHEQFAQQVGHYLTDLKGVARHRNKWKAQIRLDGKLRYLGLFATEEEAHAAYRAAAAPLDRKSKRWVSRIACYEDDRGWVEVELTQDKWTKVDIEDVALVLGHAWYFSDQGYACANPDRHEGPTIRMHRVILGLADNDPREGDHINGDPLDNRRSNLRIAPTHAHNGANRHKRRQATTSRYKGVSWDKDNAKWRACIAVNGGRLHLGRFTSEEDAARAYNEAAFEAWGEFACLNTLPSEP